MAFGALASLLICAPSDAARRKAPKSQDAPQSEENSSGDAELDAINDKLGPLLSRIGEEGARIAGGKADGLFIYAEMHKGHPDVIVFRDRGKTVKGFAETDALHDLVAQAWALNPPRRRWVVMAYSVDGRKFDAQLLYPDQVDLKKPLKDRLLPLFPKRFDGKKLVIDRKPRPSAEPDAGEGTDWKSSEDYSKT